MESIKMTSDEKHKMRTHLMSFADSYTPIVSPYHALSLMLRRGSALAFIAIVSFGSLSNIVSTNALPGDTFYPVKIAHEEIKLAATVDTQKKITYEIKRTEKRIQEATTLADKDELDIGTQATIADEIKKQTAKVKVYIEEVKTEDPEEALILNAELKSTIKVNQEALRQVAAKPTEEVEEVATKEATIVENIEEPTLLHVEIAFEDAVVVQLDEPTEVADVEALDLADIDEVEEKINDNDSFAEQLLESIEEEVLDIEAFEEQVTQEIIESEEVVLEEKQSEEVQDNSEVSDENTELITEKEEVVASIEDLENTEETLEKHISALKDLVEIKERIQALKSSDSENLVMIEDGKVIFDEEEKIKDADQFIAEKKYKSAFIALQMILEKYTEENITKDVEQDLGITLQEEELLIEEVSDQEPVTDTKIIDEVVEAEVETSLEVEEEITELSEEIVEIDNLDIPTIE